MIFPTHPSLSPHRPIPPFHTIPSPSIQLPSSGGQAPQLLIQLL